VPPFDLVIAGGTVVDGLRNPRVVTDIGIRAGRIQHIGSIPPAQVEQAGRVFDARSLVVCPGFVDLHTHYDSQVFWDPYCTISGWHGVTSVVIGNCGFGFAPVKPADRERAMLTMERNEAVRATTMAAGMPWDWETVPEFLQSLEHTPKGVNVLSYVGLNPLMTYVMGLEAAKTRPATGAERDQMAALLSDALDAGACGFSAQVLGPDSVQRDYDGTPMVTDLMSRDDLLFFASVLEAKGRGCIQVIGTDPELTEALCEASGRPVIWNALVLAADQHGNTYGQYQDVIRWIDEANARGNQVFAQALTCRNNYEFTLEEWNLFDSIPAWRAVTLGTPAERLAKMQDPMLRAAIRDAFRPGQTVVGATVTAIPELVVADVGDDTLAEYVGFSVGEIAAKQSKHPVDAMLDLAVADGLRTRFVTPPQDIDMDAMREVVNSRYALPGVSDGGAHMKFVTLGRYPTEFLSLLVRDHELMSLEEAHWRLSAYPAQAAGIHDRGFLREGAPADLLVYDLDALAVLPSERLHDFPAGDWRLACKARGYRLVAVNGQVTFDDGVCTNATPGQLLRHGAAA
jgi:N-acyl-D-aspartate/D-glutamate deacylase